MPLLLLLQLLFAASSKVWAVIVDVAVLVSGLVGVGVSGANSTY